MCVSWLSSFEFVAWVEMNYISHAAFIFTFIKSWLKAFILAVKSDFHLSLSQKTHEPSVVESQQAAAAAIFSSISYRRDREEAQKETLHLKTVDGKAGHNGEFNKPPDKWVRIFGGGLIV